MDEIEFDHAKMILKEKDDFFSLGKTLNVDFRLKSLADLAESITKNEDRIEDALFKDLHKSKFDSYATEVGYLLKSIKFMIRNLRSWSSPKRVRTPAILFGAKSWITYEPFGTVLIIGPFNYPFQLVMEPLVGAIAAGNCAVIKPSEYAPNVAGTVERIVSETFDERYVSVVKGGSDSTSALINSEFDYIFFTGSAKVGSAVLEAAAKKLVPVTLELGGKSPCIIDRDADLAAAAARSAWGKFMNAGQTCVAPDYILVHRDVKEQFLQLLIGEIKKFYGEDPQKSAYFGRIIDSGHLKRLIPLLQTGKILYGGKYDEEDLYISPTVIDGVSWNDSIMEEEIFGPILPVIQYDDTDSLIKMINSRPKPLALYIFTRNSGTERKVVERVSYGGGCINDTMTHLSTPYLPFGGVGASGMGSYHGRASFLTFSHQKSILKRSTLCDPRFLYPPHSGKKLSLLRRIYR